MIRPPSNIREYDDFWSGDPAFVQLPSDATKDQIAERDTQIRVARETGDWSALIVNGQQPTRFVMKVMKGHVYRRLIDAVVSNKVGGAELNQLAFRASIKSVVGFDKIDNEGHDLLGTIATQSIADALDSVDLKIVSELGNEALRRAREVSPK